jgi:ferric-dicitrate binding protein FerR (iron transport regulator)
VTASDESPKTCNRVSEALARLQVWGDAALLEHAKSCEICTAELAVLKKRREFRDAFPVLSSIADEAPRPSSGTSQGRASTRPGDDARSRATRRRHLLVMIAAVVAIVLFIGRNRVLHAPPAPLEGDGSTATGPPRYRIFNLANALFESKVDGTTVESSLTRGTAAFQVNQLAPNQHFFVTLPDGHLEVRGTRFVVTVEAGKTQVVDVSDGKVALRIDGRAEVVLSAGDRWPAGSGGPMISFVDLSPRKDAGAPAPTTPKP